MEFSRKFTFPDNVHCPVLAVTSWSPALYVLSRVTCLANLSRISVSAVLFRQFCHGSPATVVPFPAALSQLTCPCCQYLVVLSSRLCLEIFSRQSSLAVLSRMSCLRCPLPAILSWLSCPGCPVPAVLPRPQHSCLSSLIPLSYRCCHVWPFCPFCPI
jgi:hypothetical protein